MERIVQHPLPVSAKDPAGVVKVTLGLSCISRCERVGKRHASKSMKVSNVVRPLPIVEWN